MSVLKQTNISRAYSLFSKNFVACASTFQAPVLQPLPVLNINGSLENREKSLINPTHQKLRNSQITDKKFMQIVSPNFSFDGPLSTSSEHYENVLCQVQNQLNSHAPEQPALVSAHDTDLLECQVYSCPESLKSEWSSFFQDWDMSKRDLTLIALSHRTECNIFDWNEKMAEEREQLADSFVEAAISICGILRDLGFRADFINPHTGTPYLSAPTENSLSGTDRLWTSLGFTIEDLVCCKVLRHSRWGYQCSAGILLTDAPSNHQLLTNF